VKFAIKGRCGPLAEAARLDLQRRGHTEAQQNANCLIFFPGPSAELESLIAGGDFERLVLRSHACVYGASPKNPGLMTEQRASLLASDAAEQNWLRAERAASQFANSCILRVTNVLADAERDLVVRQLGSRVVTGPAGRDPNLQFISLSDAAGAIADAAESQARGIFNIAANGCIPLRLALRAAGAKRVALPNTILRAFAGHSFELLNHNWTVSPGRAAAELGWRAQSSTTEALREYLQARGSCRQDIGADYDDWGLDPDYLHAWSGWFAFLRRIYWRVETEGIENVPASGRALLVANHRGFMPLDGVIHLSLILKHRRRITRFLIIHVLLRAPFLSNFLTKVGGVIANEKNAERLLASENLVGIFPEGIRGAFTPYRSAYRLRDFSRSIFARLAIRHQASVVPAAVVGHAEIFPIIGRIEHSRLARKMGWPFFPIAPPFPLAPIPLPSKWHIRYLEPVSLAGLSPSDAENQRLVADFSRHVQQLIQRNVDEMVRRRRHIFFGDIFDRDVRAPKRTSAAQV
jgi:1-acyl-sn-glycerol-3-phosphate acyltransferase